MSLGLLPQLIFNSANPIPDSAPLSQRGFTSNMLFRLLNLGNPDENITENGFSCGFGGKAVPRRVSTRHLLGIGLDAKGIPQSLFTVNSWVTGDLMLSAPNTALLLGQMVLDTGYPDIDAVLESVVSLYKTEIGKLLAERDAVMFGARRPGVLADERLEVLSELGVSVDEKLALEHAWANAGQRVMHASG